MDVRCYRKILRISYKDHVTNEEVRAKIQQVIEPHKDLLAMVKRRKLHWYDHAMRRKENISEWAGECGFQAQDTLQDSTDNSSIDKVETTLE